MICRADGSCGQRPSCWRRPLFSLWPTIKNSAFEKISPSRAWIFMMCTFFVLRSKSSTIRVNFLWIRVYNWPKWNIFWKGQAVVHLFLSVPRVFHIFNPSTNSTELSFDAGGKRPWNMALTSNTANLPTPHPLNTVTLLDRESWNHLACLEFLSTAAQQDTSYAWQT